MSTKMVTFTFTSCPHSSQGSYITIISSNSLSPTGLGSHGTHDKTKGQRGDTFCDMPKVTSWGTWLSGSEPMNLTEPVELPSCQLASNFWT